MKYLYIGKTNAKRFRSCIKIGISKNVKERWKDIDRSVSGSIEYPVFSGRVFFAKMLESYFHRKYKKYRVEFSGSGKTEWFRMPVLLRAKLIFTIAALVIISRIIEFLFVLLVLIWIIR